MFASPFLSEQQVGALVCEYVTASAHLTECQRRMCFQDSAEAFFLEQGSLRQEQAQNGVGLTHTQNTPGKVPVLNPHVSCTSVRYPLNQGSTNTCPGYFYEPSTLLKKFPKYELLRFSPLSLSFFKLFQISAHLVIEFNSKKIDMMKFSLYVSLAVFSLPP